MDRTHAEIKKALKTAPVSVKQVVMSYLRFERSAITYTELWHSFFQDIDGDNVWAVAELLGEERVNGFKERLALGPRLYDEWSQIVGTVAFRWIKLEQETEEECEERRAKEAREWWARQKRGIEALRMYFRSIDPNFRD